MEQLTLFAQANDMDEGDVARLVRDMWRCIQVSPLSPPAPKESIRERLARLGTEGADA